LALLFKLVSRIPNATDKLKEIVEIHIHQMGIDAIKQISDIAFNNPKTYVETILDIYTKFFKLVKEAFNSEQGFTAALDKACAKFINNNAVTTAAGNTKKSPELLAQYCNVLLRKGNIAGEEPDFEEKLNQIMVVFNYVENKDVFLKFYRKMFAKRLVDQLCASDDYEESMISKLKLACGFDYTSELQQMFQDIRISKSLTDQYQTYCERNNFHDIVDFSVMVLKTNSWPFSAPRNFVLPIELKKPFESFTTFYTQQHNGRKLILLHQHSKGDLQTLYTEQKYTLHVSTYEMVILLLFNKRPSWTVERMQDETQIDVHLFWQVLCNLLKSKLITCPEINNNELEEDLNEKNDIKMNYNIQIANNFKSKKVKINLNVPIKSVEQKDIEGLYRTIDKDRIGLIRAALVRTMKSRQTLKHSLLMQEVIHQLSSRFKPQIPVIKKCIEKLIEEKYFERQSNENDMLNYLA
ncbi:unnamed protein product, partial [Rotaria sp. Silwood2]